MAPPKIPKHLIFIKAQLRCILRGEGQRETSVGGMNDVVGGARAIGARVLRSEDPRILTGRGRYIDDIVLPGMLHAAFKRSTVAHGRLLSVDASAARELPGVVAVYTGEDLKRFTKAAPPGSSIGMNLMPGLQAPATYALA